MVEGPPDLEKGECEAVGAEHLGTVAAEDEKDHVERPRQGPPPVYELGQAPWGGKEKRVYDGTSRQTNA